jgi:hypothetical protein
VVPLHEIDTELPLAEIYRRMKFSPQFEDETGSSSLSAAHGMIPWTRDPEILKRFAQDVEFDPLESDP